jgi:hypothetical protein
MQKSGGNPLFGAISKVGTYRIHFNIVCQGLQEDVWLNTLRLEGMQAKDGEEKYTLHELLTIPYSKIV